VREQVAKGNRFTIITHQGKISNRIIGVRMRGGRVHLTLEREHDDEQWEASTSVQWWEDAKVSHLGDGWLVEAGHDRPQGPS
jgi:hypothetical protein